MSGESYDVAPESESELIATNDSVMFDAQQDAQMHEQMLARARCIENGEDAEKFLKSNFGQYLLGQADLEAEQAKDELSDVDPGDAKTIRKLQNIIKRHRELESWVLSAIQKGDSEYKDYVQSQTES